MRNVVWMLALAALISACGGVDEYEDIDGEEGVYDAVEQEASASLAFKEVRFNVPANVGKAETRKLFKSAADFQKYFGQTATSAGLDFSKQWVVFYSAGTQSTGGYTASVKSITLSSTGKTLTLTTGLEKPGRGCMTSMMVTKPATLVSFTKPRTSQTPSNKWVRQDSVRNCTQTCDDVRCGSNELCSMDSGTPECVAYSTCANVRCAGGTHCEMKQVQCIRAPCPPVPECVPDAASCAAMLCATGSVCEVVEGQARCVPAVSQCARIRCAPGTFCDESQNGVAQCIPYSTCMNVRCASGYTCKDEAIMCVRAPCPPTAPRCVPR